MSCLLVIPIIPMETLPTLDLDDNELNLAMKTINIPWELDVNEIFLNDSQIEIIKQINKAINNGFDNSDKVETDDNNIPIIDCTDKGDNNIPIIDCKYYTTDKFSQQKFLCFSLKYAFSGIPCRRI